MNQGVERFRRDADVARPFDGPPLDARISENLGVLECEEGVATDVLSEVGLPWVPSEKETASP